MSDSIFKPLFACPAPDFSELLFPLYASPKLDGIRCLIRDGVAMTRTNKLIPNGYVQDMIGIPEYEGLDGELIIGDPTAVDCINTTTSGVMKKGGTPDFTYYVFDYCSRGRIPFSKAYNNLLLMHYSSPFIQVLPHPLVTDVESLSAYEEYCLDLGYEGIMVRSTNGPYKQGRSTVAEHYLMKVKRFMQSEAVILESIARERNDNEPTKNELGRTQRSSAKAGKVKLEMLGSWRCQLLDKDGNDTDVIFNLGEGFTHDQAKHFWKIRSELTGEVVTFKHFAGAKNNMVPRFPCWKAFRSRLDL